MQSATGTDQSKQLWAESAGEEKAKFDVERAFAGI